MTGNWSIKMVRTVMMVYISFLVEFDFPKGKFIFAIKSNLLSCFVFSSCFLDVLGHFESFDQIYKKYAWVPIFGLASMFSWPFAVSRKQLASMGIFWRENCFCHKIQLASFLDVLGHSESFQNKFIKSVRGCRFLILHRCFLKNGGNIWCISKTIRFDWMTIVQAVSLLYAEKCKTFIRHKAKFSVLILKIQKLLEWYQFRNMKQRSDRPLP